MKSLILTISMLVFSGMAVFSSCSAMAQRSKSPVPEDNTRITSPDEDEHNGIKKPHRMPRFVPQFDFNN